MILSKVLHAIEDGFGQGDSLPVQVLLSSDKELVTEDIVPYVEKLSSELEKVDGVKSVRSVTRPTGEVINEFYADYQLGKIAEGVDQASDGVGQTADGIKQSMSLPPEVQASGCPVRSTAESGRRTGSNQRWSRPGKQSAEGYG